MKKHYSLILAGVSFVGFVLVLMERGTLLDTSEFMPHGHCYLWQPGIVWLHVVSDALIFLAYVTIPVTLVYFIRKRKDLPFSWMFALFGIFIIACGTTHAMEIWTLWEPVYWLSGAIKVVTAIASIGTAILLARLIPAALAIPSPAALRQALEEKNRLIQEIGRVEHQSKKLAREVGQADVARGTLHGVGNILTVGIALLEKLKKTADNPAAKYLREALDKIRVEWKDFLGGDANHQEMAAYLDAIAKELADQQRVMLETIELLYRQVEHMDGIVAVQQQYARPGGIIERTDIERVIENALLLNAVRNETSEVRVERRYGRLPQVDLDQHVLLRMLIVAISNARHAVKDCQPDNKIIILTTGLNADEGRLFIEIEDRGVGISPQDVPKLFDLGFTTKSEGHGFGLYTSFVDAKMYGWDFSIHSEGIGLGAKVTIMIPLNDSRREK